MSLLNKSVTKLSEKHAFDLAVNYLARRDHTRAELSAKLKKKGFEKPTVASALDRCEILCYLDDEKTAYGIYRHLFSSGYGPHRIRMTMKQKGVDAGLIEKIIEEKYDKKKELESARRMLNKKQSGLAREKNLRKRREKAWRYLYNRGFTKDALTTLIGWDKGT